MKKDFQNIDLLSIIFPLISVLLAFVIGAVLIAISEVSPLLAYKAMIRSAFGNINNFGETLVRMVPLLLAGLGTAVALRAKIFNIGQEGQIQMGAIGAAVAGLFIRNIPAYLGITLTILLGFIFGGIWAGIAGLIKIRFKTNETIITLMMNYIALGIVSYLITGPWRDPMATEAFTAIFSPQTTLPIILPHTRLHAGFIVAIIATIILSWVFRNTVYGYQSRVMGMNERTAKYSGIKINRTVVITMLISGGLCGLAGAGEVSGVHHRVLAGFSPGYGYTAIAVAMLGRLHPFGILAASFLFAALVVGADGMQLFVSVPVSLIYVIEGLVLFFLLAGEMILKKQKLKLVEEVDV